MANDSDPYDEEEDEAPSDTPQRPVAVTKLVDIGGQQVLCKFLTEAQVMQLAYESQVLRAANTPEDRKVKMLGRVFRIMRSVVVEDEDKEYLEDLMADGTVDMYDLVEVIKELNESQNEGKPVAKVRRGTVQRTRRR